MLAACTAKALPLLTDQAPGIPLHATFINTQLHQGLSGLTSLSPFEKLFFDKEAESDPPPPKAISPPPPHQRYLHSCCSSVEGHVHPGNNLSSKL